MACRFTELVIDCHDHRRLAQFWSEVLGYRTSDSKDGPDHWYVQLEGPPGAGPSILLIRVPDEKTVKNRVHIDVNPTDREQNEEVERILALGATRKDIGQGDQSWVVLGDPEGNEFCVLRGRVEPHPAG
jgi:predicted enzyme related to lactoylglutathione lyase